MKLKIKFELQDINNLLLTRLYAAQVEGQTNKANKVRDARILVFDNDFVTRASFGKNAKHARVQESRYRAL